MAIKIKPSMPEVDALPIRARMAPDDATIRGLPFMGIEAAVTKYASRQATDALAKQVGLEGGHFNRMGKFRLADFLRYEKIAAEEIATAAGGFDSAIFEIGFAAVELFFESVAGRTMKLLAGDEPHRLLSSVPSGYEVLVSFGSRSYKKTSQRSGLFHFKQDYLGPVHSAGVFDAGVRYVYDIDAKFELAQSTPDVFTFSITW